MSGRLYTNSSIHTSAFYRCDRAEFKHIACEEEAHVGLRCIEK